jgi:hypothetical protein
MWHCACVLICNTAYSSETSSTGYSILYIYIYHSQRDAGTFLKLFIPFFTRINNASFNIFTGARSSVLVKALRYKPEGLLSLHMTVTIYIILFWALIAKIPPTQQTAQNTTNTHTLFNIFIAFNWSFHSPSQCSLTTDHIRTKCHTNREWNVTDKTFSSV